MTTPASCNQQVVSSQLYPSSLSSNSEDAPYIALNTASSDSILDCFYHEDERSTTFHIHKLRVASALSFVMFFVLGGVGLHTAAHNEEWSAEAQEEMVFSGLFFIASLAFCAISLKKHGC